MDPGGGGGGSGGGARRLGWEIDTSAPVFYGNMSIISYTSQEASRHMSQDRLRPLHSILL